MLHFLLAIALQQSAPPRTDSTGNTLDAPRIESAAIDIDGTLDEDAWQRAARLTGFSQFEPIDGRPAEENTEVLVFYEPDAIYFGIIARDREPGTIRATNADRDNIGTDDHVILYLDTFNDRRRAFFFAVNPLGVQQDGVRTEGASNASSLFGGNIDTNPDYLYQSRGRVTAEGYVVEVRIPFKSLRLPGTGAQSWGLQVLRKVQRTGYTDTWTPARRASASFLLQAGTLTGLRDLKRGVVFEAQPFITATSTGVRTTSAGFERGDPDADAGVNLRAGFTNLSLDATLNPDFSQVESDVGQVTINERFALFFPEKRPFFLEGIELFATPGQLVYTRQIANPLVGGKITGKVGAVGVAHLTALDERVDTAGRDALFNITRLRRDFGSNSLVGFTFTDRSVTRSADFNRVAAADLRYVFGRMYYFETQVGRSFTRENAQRLDANAWKVEVDRTGRSFGFNYHLDGAGRNFLTRSGYVPRSGVVNGHVFNRYTYYGRRGALLENLTMFGGIARIWSTDRVKPGDSVEGNESFTANARFRGGWIVQGSATRAFVEIDPALYASYTLNESGRLRDYVPLSNVAGPTTGIEITTPAFQLFDAGVSLRYGRAAIFPEGSEGNGLTFTARVAFRPTESIRTSLSFTNARLERARDGSEFARTLLPRLATEFQPTRSFFLRVITEYRSERQAALQDARSGLPLFSGGVPIAATRFDGLRVDVLASFEPTPGTVAFLGYGSSLEGNEEGFRTLRPMSDGFFLKLAYQFRR